MVDDKIIVYQADDNDIQLEVRVEEDTVWLSQSQMCELFGATKQNVSLHINNIYKEGELNKEATVKDSLTVRSEGGRNVKRRIQLYNLDVIISVGYRVKSLRGTQFRIWANAIIKDFLLKGYAINQRVDKIEKTLLEHTKKFDLLLETNLPQKEGVFFDGQVFDAWVFVSSLIKDAKESITLIDNYVDETVLALLAERTAGVRADIYTYNISQKLGVDLEKHNAQYSPINIHRFKKSHDRFLIIDNKDLYHIGASLKDLGKRWFAFSKINLDVNEIIMRLNK